VLFVWVSQFAVCVGITVCSLCGYHSVHSVWVSQCAVCVSITVCSLCGYHIVQSVWVSQCAVPCTDSWAAAAASSLSVSATLLLSVLFNNAISS